MANEVIVPEVAVETAETPLTETAVARDESGKFISHQARKADLHSRLMAEGEAEAKAALEAEVAADTSETQETPAKPPEKVSAEKPKSETEKADAKAFAALARQKTELRQLESKVATEKQAAETMLNEAKDRQSKAEARVKELEALFNDPTKFFEYGFDHLGLKTEEDFKKYAKNQWQRQQTGTTTAAKPLTEADVAAAVKKDREAREATQATEAIYINFDKLMQDEKYEASSLIYSRAEARKVADDICNKLNALGKTPRKPNGDFDLEAVADAVDEWAQEDERYKRLVARGLPAKKAAATTTEDKTKVVAKVDPKKVVVPAKTNGAAAKPLTHKERVALTMEAARKAS